MERVLGVGPRAQQTFLLEVPRRQQDGAAGSATHARRLGVGFGDLDQRHGARAIVVRTVVDHAALGTVVVEVGAHDDPLVLQFRVRAFDEADHVARGMDLPSHVRRDHHIETGEGNGCGASLVLRAARQLRQRATGALDETLRQRRGDADGGDPDPVQAALERVAPPAARGCGPVAGGLGAEVAGFGVIVDVRYQEGRDCPGLLRGGELAVGGGGLRSDEAIEGALGVRLFRFVIEDEDDVSRHAVAVVVVALLRRGDPEAGEHDLPAGRAAPALSQGVELLAALLRDHPPVVVLDGQAVVLPDLGLDDVEGVVVGAARSGRLESESLEARLDEGAREAALGRAGEAAAHLVSREEEEVGAEVGPRDRFDGGGGLLGARRCREREGADTEDHGDEPECVETCAVQDHGAPPSGGLLPGMGLQPKTLPAMYACPRAG